MTQQNIFKLHPDADHRFFIYDPCGPEFMFFKTAEERDAASRDVIAAHCDECWSEEVERVVAGEVTHQAVKTNIQHRPKQESFETVEEFEDEMDEFAVTRITRVTTSLLRWYQPMGREGNRES